MKIFSFQSLKVAAVVLGLLAVTLAFRSGKAKQSAKTSVDFEPIRIQSVPAPEVLQLNALPLPVSSGDLGPVVATTSYPDSNHGGFEFSNQVAFAAPPAVEEASVLGKPELAPVEDFDLTLDSSPASSLDNVDVDFAKSEEAPAAQPAESVEPIGEAQPVEFAQPLSEVTNTPIVIAPLNDAAAQKAVHHIEYGKSLARRNATEAAGQEFLGALRVLAESNDTAVGGNDHTTALRNGLLAIREATDFKTDDPQRQLVIDVASVIEGHQSRILGADEAAKLTASSAMRHYFDYAGQQLGKCGGQNAVAAEALYCLGKMKTIASDGNPDPESLDTYEGIIFHHASLAADPGNFRSANELGVLLAKNGHLSAAEAYLKNSLQLNAIPQAWANLAKVHMRKGTAQDQQLANLAAQEYQVALSQPPQDATQGVIQWVEPAEFIARSPTVIHNHDSPLGATAQTVVPVANVQPENESRSLVQRIGSLFVPKKTNR